MFMVHIATSQYVATRALPTFNIESRHDGHGNSGIGFSLTHFAGPSAAPAAAAGSAAGAAGAAAPPSAASGAAAEGGPGGA